MRFKAASLPTYVLTNIYGHREPECVDNERTSEPDPFTSLYTEIPRVGCRARDHRHSKSIIVKKGDKENFGRGWLSLLLGFWVECETGFGELSVNFIPKYYLLEIQRDANSKCVSYLPVLCVLR